MRQVVVVVLALGVAACSGPTNPQADRSPPTSVASTSAVTVSVAGTDLPPATTTSTPKVEFLAVPDAQNGPSLLVPDDNGLSLIEVSPAGAVTARRTLVTDEVRAGFDDLAGGLVFQVGARTHGVPFAVYALPAGMSTPTLLARPENGADITLVAVQPWAGRPSAFMKVTVLDNLERGTLSAGLHILDLASGERIEFPLDAQTRVHVGPELLVISGYGYDPDGSTVWAEGRTPSGPLPLPLGLGERRLCGTPCHAVIGVSTSERRLLVSESPTAITVELDSGVTAPAAIGHTAHGVWAAGSEHLPQGPGEPVTIRHLLRRFDGGGSAVELAVQHFRWNRGIESPALSFARTRPVVAAPVTVALEVAARSAPPVLLAETDQVVLDDGGNRRVLVNGRVSVAVDDLAGGLVVARRAPDLNNFDGSGQILRLRAGSRTPELLAEHGRLVNVELIDGAAAAIYSLLVEGETQVRAVPLDGGAERILLRLPTDVPGHMTARVVTANGLIVVERFFPSGDGLVEFYDLGGGPVTMEANPRPTRCHGMGSDCNDAVQLRADGGTIAYRRGGPDSGFSVRDLRTGLELARFTESLNGVPADLSDKAMTVRHLTMPLTPPSPVDLWMLDRPTGPVRRLSTGAHSARFPRSTIRIDQPVTI